MTRQTSIQLGEATTSQVTALTNRGFGNRSQIIRTAIDRMYREEIAEGSRLYNEVSSGEAARFVYEFVYDSIPGERDARLDSIAEWIADGDPAGMSLRELAEEYAQKIREIREEQARADNF